MGPHVFSQSLSVKPSPQGTVFGLQSLGQYAESFYSHMQ